MKAMEHLKEGSTLLAGGIGVVVGIIKFLDVYLLTDSYFLALLKSAITALVCGGAGVIGKIIVDRIRKNYFNNKNKIP